MGKILMGLNLIISLALGAFTYDTTKELLSQTYTIPTLTIIETPTGTQPSSNALDSDLLKTTEITPSPTSNCSWIVHFTDNVATPVTLSIDAVLIQMPESINQNGSYKVVIGGSSCTGQPPSAMVAGGAFSCSGISGSFIGVFCTTPPCGVLRIALIRAWTWSCVSCSAQPSLWGPSYMLNTPVVGGRLLHDHRQLVTNTGADIYSFTQTGSFLSPYWASLAGMNDPSIKALSPVTVACLILRFNYRSRIKEILFIMSSPQVVSVEMKDSNDYNVVGQGTMIVTNQLFSTVQTVSCDTAGGFMFIYTSDPVLFINKVVAVGYDCQTKPIAITKWRNHAIQVASNISFISFEAPTIDEGCVWSYNLGYNIEFFDDLNNNLYWINYSKPAGREYVNIFTNATIKSTYEGKIVIVTIRYKANFSGTVVRDNAEAKFQLAFGAALIDSSLDFSLPKVYTAPDSLTADPLAAELCPTTNMVSFLGTLGVPKVYIFDAQPVYLTLPQIKDTVSNINGLFDGFTFCGRRSYFLREPSPIAQIALDESTFKVELQSFSRADAGYKLINVLVGLYNYTEVLPTTLTFVVHVIDRCADTALIRPTELAQQSNLTLGYLALQLATYNVPRFDDLVSQSYGLGDGFTFCGARTFSFSPALPFLQWASTSPVIQRPKDYLKSDFKDTIVGQSRSQSDIGDWLVTVTVGLKDYPQVSASFQLAVQVKSCIVDHLEVTPGSVKLPDLTIIAEFPSSTKITMPVIQWAPNCPDIGAQVQLTLAMAPQPDGRAQQLPKWIRLDQDRVYINVSADDKISLTGLFAFEVVATLDTNGKLFTHREQFRVFIANDIALPLFDPLDPETIGKAIEQSKTPDVQPVASVPLPLVSRLWLDEGVTKEQWDTIFNGLYDAPSLKPKFSHSAIPIPPKVQVKEINAKGMATLRFNRSMLTFGNIKTRVVQIEENQQTRMLQANQTVEFVTQRIFDVALIPGNNSALNISDFDYDAWFQDSETLKVQLKFSQPETVSAGQPEDVVELKFSTPFIDQQFGLPLESASRELRFPIPPQASPGAIMTTIEVASQTLVVGSGVAIGTNALSNIFLQASLNQVWGMINNLQMVVNYPMINIQFPGNAFGLFNSLIMIASFDFLPTDSFYPQIFRTPEVDPFSDKLDRVGVSGKFIIMNMGTLTIFILWQIALYPIYLVAYVFSRRSKFMRAIKNRLQNNLFWNGTILLVQEAYLDICICGLINALSFGEFSWKHPGIVLSNVITILLLSGVIVLPLVVLFYLKPRFHLLTEESFEEKFSSSYEMISLKGRPSALWYVIAFYFRRAAFAASVIFLAEFPFLQIVSLIVPTLVILIILGEVKPMPSRQEQRLETFDNITILSLTYTLLCFTEFVKDSTARYDIGYAMILIVMQNVTVHITFLSIEPITKLRDLVRNRYANWQRAKTFFSSLTREDTKRQFLAKIKTLKSEFFEEHMSTISEEESPRPVQEAAKRVKREVPEESKQRQKRTKKRVKKILRLAKRPDLKELPKPGSFSKTVEKLQEKARSVSRQRKRRIDLDYPEPRGFYENPAKNLQIPTLLLPGKSSGASHQSPSFKQVSRQNLSQFKQTFDIMENLQTHDPAAQSARNRTKNQKMRQTIQQRRKQVIRNWDGDKNTPEVDSNKAKPRIESDSEDEFATTLRIPRPKRRR